jgi:hypothetical protein
MTAVITKSRTICWLKGREGDAANVVLSAAGYNLYGAFLVKQACAIASSPEF